MRQVQDGPGPAVDRAQHQIMVLDPIQAGAQAAEPLQQVEADGEEVVHIILAEQAFAVEPGLELRRRPAALAVDRVLV